MPDMSRDESFGADMALLGLRRRFVHNIGGMFEGPFLFGGVITDGATTPADLTLIAACLDPRIRDIYLTNDPKLILHIEAVEFYIEQSGLIDTEALAADLFENVMLYHKDGAGREDRINVFPFGGTTFTEPAVSTTQNNEEVQRYAKVGRIFELPSPWEVNFETDTFDVEPRVLVNTAADVPFQLIVHGAIWPGIYGVLPPVKCFDMEKAKALRSQRLQAAQERQARNRDRS